MLSFLKIEAQAVTDPGHQAGNRLEIIKTDLFHYASFGKDSLRIRKLLGHVHLRQDTTDLFCDSAYQFIDSNFVVAYSNVKIVLSRSRTITARQVTYDGDSKILNFWDNVVLSDSNVTLRTPRLTYYRQADYAEYLQGGIIEDEENTLTSKNGFYYPSRDMAYFKKAVKLVNPQFTLVTDTLGYNTKLKVAYFMAPTTVKDSINSMYTEDGYYDTKNDYAFLNQNASIGDSSYTIFADTIQYDQKRDLGKALGNLKIEQKDSSMTVYGKYGEFKSKTEATFVTDSAFAIQYFDDDTLYLFADTLTSFKDTVEDKRYFFAYKDASFFMRELQGVSDSLVYWYDDSLMFFYQKPALWSGTSQITGDTMIIVMRNGTIDSMSIPNRPYISTKEDTVGYDQIKGKALFAKFEEKHLRKMWIFGNSESIYFTKDDKDEYMGMNRAKCSDMFIEFKDNKPNKILFKDQPSGEFFPIHMVLYKENLLEDFKWREKERPERPTWVYDIVNRDLLLRDTLRMRWDSLMMEIEDLEFATFDILSDSLVNPDEFGAGFEDSLTYFNNDSLQILDSLGIGIDSLGISQEDSLSPKGNIKGGTNPKVDQEVKPIRRRDIPKDQREELSFKEHVALAKTNFRNLMLTKEQQKSIKDFTVSGSLKALVKKLKYKPSKAELKAREEAKKKAKIDKMRMRISNKAQRKAGKHARKLNHKFYRKRMQMRPKDAEFNDVRLGN